MAIDDKIKLTRSAVPGLVPPALLPADFGLAMVNIYDRKLYITNAAGAPVITADRIMPHDAAKTYAAGDLITHQFNFWSANTNLIAKPFIASDWTQIGGGGSDAILRIPAGVQTNTIDLTSVPAFTGLRIVGPSNQSAPLLEIPGTNPNDGRVATIDQFGFPNSRLGPVIRRVSQGTHPFSFVGQAATFEGGAWKLCNATLSSNILQGCIEQVIDANTFVVRFAGEINGLQTSAFVGGVILPNTRYYLSDTNPGMLTSVVPVTRQDIVLVTTTNTSGVVRITSSFASDSLPLTGGTMSGSITMGDTDSINWVNPSTRIVNRTGNVELEVFITNLLAGRVDAPGVAMTSQQTLMTQEKGLNIFYTKAQTDALLAPKVTQTQTDLLYLSLGGGTLTGALLGTTAAFASASLTGNLAAATIGLTGLLTGVTATFTGQVSGITPTAAANLTRKDYVDAQVALKITQAQGDARYLQLTGGTVTGQVNGITPVAAANLTRKDYVDTKLKTNIFANVVASGTAIDFTGIGPEASMVEVMFTNISTNTAADRVGIRLGTAGSFIAAGYNDTFWEMSNNPAVFSDAAYFPVTSPISAGESASGVIRFSLMQPGNDTWAMMGNTDESTLSGWVTLNALLTRIRFFVAVGAGSFDLGSVNVRWS